MPKKEAKTYEFLCKRGQEFIVSNVLRILGCWSITISPYYGTRGNYSGCSDSECCDQVYREGMMVRCKTDLSRTKIDKEMKERRVPGAS